MAKKGVKEGAIPVKEYTLTELAGIYDIDYRTLKTWLQPFKKQLGKKVGIKYSVPQVKIIFEKLGIPHTITLKRPKFREVL